MAHEVGLCDLPAELLAVIVSHISAADGVRLHRCCHHLRAAVKVALNATEENWLQNLRAGVALPGEMIKNDNARWLAACPSVKWCPWFQWWSLFEYAARRDALKCVKYIWENHNDIVREQATSLWMDLIGKNRESKFCALFAQRIMGPALIEQFERTHITTRCGRLY